MVGSDREGMKNPLCISDSDLLGKSDAAAATSSVALGGDGGIDSSSESESESAVSSGG